MSIADLTRSTLLAAQGVNALVADMPRIFPTEVNVLNFDGVDPTGTTDSSAGIQSALDSLTNGQNLVFPPGTYLIASTITLGDGTSSADSSISGVRIIGRGFPTAKDSVGFTKDSPVIFKWSGTAGGVILTIAGPLQGWGIENIRFDAGTGAATGINVVSASMGNCLNLSFKGFTGEAIISQTYGTFATLGHANCMHNTWINIYIQITTASAFGIILTGTVTGTPANTCYNTFINLTFDILTGSAATGIYLAGCDSIRFMNTHYFGGTLSAGVVFDYTAVTDAWPDSIIFDGIDTASLAFGFQNVGTPGQFARTNYILAPFEANGAVVPRIANLVNLTDTSQAPPWAVATGIGDSLVMTYQQTWNNLPDGKLVFARTLGPNVGTSPFFQVTDNGTGSGFAAARIAKNGTGYLLPGDLPYAGFEGIFRYNATSTVWELLNPAAVQPPWALGSGTNAVVATYSPPIPTLYTGLLVGVRLAAANTSINPTFAPDGLGAQQITKWGGLAVNPGDMLTSQEAFLRYNGTSHWELMNPSTIGILWNNAAGGSANTITASYSPSLPIIYDGILVGYRAATDNTSAGVSFNPDSLGAINITKYGGQNLNPGDIKGGSEYILRLNASLNRWELLNPSTLSPAATTAGGLPGVVWDGLRQYVTDSNSTTFFAGYTGGGTAHCPIFYDSSAGGWRIG